VWSSQADENIHNNDKRETLKKKAGRDLNVSGTREIAASTRITMALSPSMVERGMVDRWFRSKQSKNLENVAEREKSRRTWKKKREEKMHAAIISRKIFFFGRISMAQC